MDYLTYKNRALPEMEQLVKDYFYGKQHINDTKLAKKLLNSRLGTTLYPVDEQSLMNVLTDYKDGAYGKVFSMLWNHAIDMTGGEEVEIEHATITQRAQALYAAKLVHALLITAYRRGDQDDWMFTWLMTAIIEKPFSLLLSAVDQYRSENTKLTAKLEKANKRIGMLEKGKEGTKPEPVSKRVDALRKVMVEERDAHLKQMAVLEHDLRMEYQETIDAQAEEIQALTRRLNTALAELSTVHLEPTEEEELPEIPERGVIFIGGHQNFLAKLRAIYPDWVYNPIDAIPTAKYKVVCFDHANHTIEQRADKANPNVPKFYVQSTNIQLALTQIQMGIAQVEKECAK